MTVSRKTILLSAAALVVAGLAGVAYYKGGQRVDDSIVTQLDAYKGRDVDGLVFDWAERTQQDGRTTLRNLTGHQNGTLVLSADTVDIARNGLSLQAIGRNVTITDNRRTQKAETVTLDGPAQAMLGALFTASPASMPDMLATLNGASIRADGLVMTERLRTTPVTARRLDASLTGGKIGHLQVQDITSRDHHGTVTIGAVTLENLSIELLHALHTTERQTVTQFMALMDGTSVKVDRTSIQENSDVITVDLMQGRFSGSYINDIRVTAVNAKIPDSLDDSMQLGMLTIDRINLPAVISGMQSAAFGSTLGEDVGNFGINTAEMLDFSAGAAFRIGSLTLARQDQTFEARAKNIAFDMSALPAGRRGPEIPPISIAELVSRERRGTNTLASDLTLPVQSLLNLRSYHRFDNLNFSTTRGPQLPDPSKSGQLTVNMQIEDHGLNNLIAERSGQSRDQNATQARITSRLLIQQFKIDDTINLPARLAAFVQTGTPLAVGIGITVDANRPMAIPQIRLTEPERLSLD